MRKSNFLKKAFSSVGTSSPHFQKKFVTYNISALLLIMGNMFVFSGSITAFAQEDITPMEVTTSAPDNSAMLAELTSINYRLDDLNTTLEEDVVELQNTNEKLDTLVGVSGYIFGAIFMIIICIVFIAVCKLFNTFFRF